MFDLPSSDDDARSCVINAVRNFGVLATVAAGDEAGAQASVDQIIASCTTPTAHAGRRDTGRAGALSTIAREVSRGSC